MVAGREDDAVRGLVRRRAERQPLHIASLAALAEHMPLPATLGRAAFEEALPLGLGVERGEGHKQVVLSLRHGQREAIGGEGLPASLPVRAAIAEAPGTHTDRIMVREADIQPPSGGATRSRKAQ